MLQLIKKDIVIHKLSWLIYMAMIAIFIYAGNDIIFIAALMSAVITMYVFYADEKANGHRLWNALPFCRSEIVGARYVSLIVNMAICILFIMGIEFIAAGGLGAVFWKEILGGLVLVLISSAVFFPLFYLLSQRNVVFIFLVLYILLVIGGAHFLYYLYVDYIHTSIIPRTFSETQFFSFGILLALFFYGISYGISMKIYRNKEII